VVCPSDETLRTVLESADQETSSTAVLSHLVGCVDCQSRICAWNEQSRLDQILNAAGNSNVEFGNNSESAEIPADTVTNAYGNAPLRQIGQYQLLRTLGRGGGGEVFEARHALLHRRVAIKLMSPRHSGDEVARQRFFREMESIGKLNDDYIVHAYDAGEIDGTLYLAMELVNGENLDSLAQRVGPMPVADACEIIRQAALGLQHVRDVGLVHRDLKPSNLLMSRNGIKIADLGLALLNRSNLRDDQLTGENTVVGTVDYMAPEQAEKSHNVDIRADIYSLGCTLFRLLAGRAPYAVPENNTAVKKLYAHSSHPIPDIIAIRPDVPRELAAILRKMMAKDRNDRYAEPIQLAQVIAPFCATADYPSLVVSRDPATDDSHRSAMGRNSTDRLKNRSDTQKVSNSFSSVTIARTGAKYLAAAIVGVVFAIAWSGKNWTPRENSDTTAGTQPVTTVPITLQLAATQPASQRVEPKQSDTRIITPPAEKPISQRWHQEFGAAPIEFQWPGRSGIGTWRLDEDLRSLVIQCRGNPRFVKLAETRRGQCDFKLGVDIMPEVEAGFGIFFGMQPDAGDQPDFWKFQAIQIDLVTPPDAKTNARLRRFKGTAYSTGGRIYTDNNVHESIIIENLDRFRLEIQIKDTQLNLVLIDGLRRNSDLMNNNYFEHEYVGALGVYSQDGTVSFSNPHFERLKR